MILVTIQLFVECSSVLSDNKPHYYYQLAYVGCLYFVFFSPPVFANA